MNPAPDAELASVGEFYHNWVTDAVVRLVFKRLEEPREQRYRWDALLNSAADQSQRTLIPQPVREATADIAAGASDLVEEATRFVENLISPEESKQTQPLSTSMLPPSDPDSTAVEPMKPARSTVSKTPRSSAPKKGSTKTTQRLKKPTSDA
jgi:hypothetical protein